MKRVALVAALLAVAYVLPFLNVSHGPMNSVQAMAASAKDIVAFNTKNNKFHSLSCMWAERCTVNCISVTRAEAHNRGGIPCKVCGGGE